MSATRDLPRWLHDLIGSPPAAGTGLHAWLFRCARQLHAHRAPDEIEALLGAAVEGCGRHVPAREIQNAVRNSGAHAWRPGASRAIAPGGTTAAPPRWPGVDEARRAAVIASGFTLADLWEWSPVCMDADGPATEEILDTLFPPSALLCVAVDKRRPATVPREALRGRLAGLQLIVPNPMTAPTGRNLDGRESPRCLANTGARRFLVVEFDSGTTNEHAAILAHLADFGPLALVVHSGGKSLHGWFRAHADETVCRRFFDYAVSLGADPATWCRCQFVRMPGGRRDNGARQLIWFFNPGVIHAN